MKRLTNKKIKRLLIAIMVCAISYFFIIHPLITVILYDRYIVKNDVDDKYIPYLEDEFGFVYTQRVSIAEIYHHGGLAALSLKLQDDDMNYYIIQVLGFSKEVADDIDYNSSTNGVLGNKKEIPMVSIDMRDDSFYFTYNMDGSTYIIIYKRHMKDRNKFYEIFE